MIREVKKASKEIMAFFLRNKAEEISEKCRIDKEEKNILR